MISISLLLVGCTGGVVTKKTINLSWRNISADPSLMAEGGEKIMVGKRYSYMPTSMDVNAIEVEADINGKKTGNFEFQLASGNDFTQVANNKIVIEPTAAEDPGTMLVSTEGQEEIFDYVIFPAVVLSAWGSPRKETAYSFEQEKHVMFDEADIWFVTDEEGEAPYRFIANVAIVDSESFWTSFINANNLHEYDYEVQSFRPGDDNKLYFIKTKNNHYVVLQCTAATTWTFNFMYKYSETGVFPEYEYEGLN